MKRFSSSVEYLNSTDTTIMGSRNGQASLAMWFVPSVETCSNVCSRYALQQKRGVEGLRKDATKCFENARYLHGLFKEAKVATLLNNYSTTVVFEKPSDPIVKKWQLACTGTE